MNMRGTGIAAASLVLVSLVACGRGGDDAKSPKQADSGIGVMQFRAVPDGDPLLGSRHRNAGGRYSFRPPAPWVPVKSPPPAAGKPARFRSHLSDPAGKGYMDASVASGGPPKLDPVTMNGLKNALGEPLAKAVGGTLIGADLFRFKDFTVLQVMTRKDEWVLLNLLFFRNPGSYVQVTYAAPASLYHKLARAIEASIASFEWEG